MMIPTCGNDGLQRYLLVSHSTLMGEIRSPYQSTVPRMDPTKLWRFAGFGTRLLLIAGFVAGLDFFADMIASIVYGHKTMTI